MKRVAIPIIVALIVGLALGVLIHPIFYSATVSNRSDNSTNTPSELSNEDERTEDYTEYQNSLARIDYPLIDIYFDKEKTYSVTIKEYMNDTIFKEYSDVGDYFQFNKEYFAILTVPSGRGTTPPYVLSVYEDGNLIKEIDCAQIISDILDGKNKEEKSESTEFDELSKGLAIYRNFLQDKITSVGGKINKPCSIKDLCNDYAQEKGDIKFALFDMTGDRLPELHILTDNGYFILTIESDNLIIWLTGDRYVRPLNNRATLEVIESTGIHYSYNIPDHKGDSVFTCDFSKPPDNELPYLFSINNGDSVELSKKDWSELVAPILSIGSDDIVWKSIDDIDF